MTEHKSEFLALQIRGWQLFQLTSTTAENKHSVNMQSGHEQSIVISKYLGVRLSGRNLFMSSTRQCAVSCEIPLRGQTRDHTLHPLYTHTQLVYRILRGCTGRVAASVSGYTSPKGHYSLFHYS